MATQSPNAYDLMKNPNQTVYDPAVIEALNKYVTTPADTSNLPLPENIIGQGIQNTADASKKGIMPAIMSGLTSIAQLANTSTGTRLMSQALGGDVYTKTAMEQAAQGQKGVEGGIRALAAQGEEARKENLAKYGIEELKAQTEASRENQMQQFQAGENVKNREAEANRQNTQVGAEEKRQTTSQQQALIKEQVEANKDLPELANLKTVAQISAYLNQRGKRPTGAFAFVPGRWGGSSTNAVPFTSEQEAESSGLPKGTKVTINGKTGSIQ
jgi:hypothetical protein